MKPFPIEQFICSGKYVELKNLKKQLDTLKNLIRQKQEALNVKRMYWEDIGVIGKFDKHNTYKYDQLSLNQLLQNLGILPLVAELDETALKNEQLEYLKKNRLSYRTSVSYKPNSVIRADMSLIKRNMSQFNEVDIQKNVRSWLVVKQHFEKLDLEWKRLKQIFVTSSVFKHSSIYSSNFGTFKVTESNSKYNIEAVFQLLGTEGLVKIGKVNISLLEEFMAKGFINRSEFNKYYECFS